MEKNERLFDHEHCTHFLYRILDSKKTSRFQFSIPGLREIHRNLKQQKHFDSRDGFFRKSPFCTFFCINPGFGRSWGMLWIFFVNGIFANLPRYNYNSEYILWWKAKLLLRNINRRALSYKWGNGLIIQRTIIVCSPLGMFVIVQSMNVLEVRLWLLLINLVKILLESSVFICVIDDPLWSSFSLPSTFET